MSNRNLLVSILIITYNYEKELIRALNAIKKQSYKNYEVIIVDDASSDNTIATTNAFIYNNPELNIQLICHDTNQGIIAARNTALQYAKGDYLYIHDADDWMEPDCLAELVNAAQVTNADRVIGEFQDVDTNGKILQIRNIDKNSSKWLHNMHDASLYKHSIIQKNKIRYIDGTWDDLAFKFLFSFHSKKTTFVHKVLFNYYVNTKSASGAQTLANAPLNIDKFSFLLKLFKQYQPKMEESDWIMAEYYLIKYYFFSLLHEGRYSKVKSLLQRYQTLHNEIKLNLPNYSKNKNLTLFKANHDRTYGRVLTYLLVHLEKLHILPLCLIIYHFLSKFKYFPV